MSIKIVLPIYWQTSKKKTVLCGMNWFRNAYYHQQSAWKKDFHELVAKQVSAGDKIPSPYHLQSKLFYKNSTCDGSNIIALMEKVLLDSLQNLEVVVNDSVKHHTGSTFEVMEQDKINPRCEIEIRSLDG